MSTTWEAILGKGTAQAGGDPDPTGWEKTLVISSKEVKWMGKGGYQVTDANSLSNFEVTTGDGETMKFEKIESEWKVTFFGYETPEVIFYK